MFEKLFSRRGLSLDRLRSFLEVVEAGGIARAVGTDPVRQSQYSRQISELEEFFGVELLKRRGRRVTVSDVGAKLARAIREQFRGLEDFAKKCSDEPVRFSIGAGDSLIQWLILPRIATIHKAFPSVTFNLANLTTQNIVEGLRELTLDFGIARQDGISGGLKTALLGTVDFALLVPKLMLASKKERPGFFEALARFPVATQSSSSQFAEHLNEIVAKKKVPTRIALECESFPQALGALRTGQYAAILPRLAMAEIDSESYLEIPTRELASQSRKIVLAWNPRTIRLREGAEKLQKAFAEQFKFK